MPVSKWSLSGLITVATKVGVPWSTTSRDEFNPPCTTWPGRKSVRQGAEVHWRTPQSSLNRLTSVRSLLASKYPRTAPCPHAGSDTFYYVGGYNRVDSTSDLYT